ncbi:MAG: hypothetical protein HY681_15115 [Chloroflexi bacterium]|nr:hypothetical protein [Chloroflexota bacterium]
MNAVDLLQKVRALGGRLEARGERLHIEAPAPLPGPLLEELRQHKPALLEALQNQTTPRLGDPNFHLDPARCYCGKALFVQGADGSPRCYVHAPIESILELQGWCRVKATRLTGWPENPESQVILTVADDALAPEHYRDLPRLSLAELADLYGREPFPSLGHMRLVLLAKQLCPGAHVESHADNAQDGLSAAPGSREAF